MMLSIVSICWFGALGSDSGLRLKEVGWLVGYSVPSFDLEVVRVVGVPNEDRPTTLASKD